MKIVSMFETADGKQFSSRDEARKHEVEIETMKKLSVLLESSIRTGRPDSVLRHMMLESLEIMAILGSHRKKMPREAAKQKAAA